MDGAAVAQWPKTAALRRQYATYLVEELAEDIPGGPIQLADYFSAGLTATPHEGYVEFGSTGILCTERYAPPEVVYASSLVELALQCLLLRFHGIFVASFAYSRSVSAAAAARPFWADVFRAVSWVATPSPMFVPLLSILRHDIRQFVFRARQNMAMALRSNQKVDHALVLLIGGSVSPRRPWRVEEGSALSGTLMEAMTNAQVVAMQVDAGGEGHVDLVIEPTDGGEPFGLRMAERDRLLLAVLLLYAETNGSMGRSHAAWIKRLPSRAPESFGVCRRAYPELWAAGP